MEYINLSSEGLNNISLAIRERNRIERERLEFDKTVFEFNKQLNIDAVKANTDIAETIASMSNNFNQLRETINVLAQNDAFLKKEIDKLNFSVTNLQ